MEIQKSHYSSIADRHDSNQSTTIIPDFGVELYCNTMNISSRDQRIPRSKMLLSHRKSKNNLYQWTEISEFINSIVHQNRNDRIVMVRHGQTRYNERNIVSGQHDTKLSEKGRDEARLIKKIININYDLIVCSALSRTVQTMSIVLEDSINAETAFIIDSRLNEVNLGILQGRRRAFIPEFSNGNIDFAPKNGESYRQAAQRVFSALIDIFKSLEAAGKPPRTALVFCHAGIMRIASTLAYEIENSSQIFDKSPKNLERLELRSRTMRLAEFWGRPGDDFQVSGDNRS